MRVPLYEIATGPHERMRILSDSIRLFSIFPCLEPQKSSLNAGAKADSSAGFVAQQSGDHCCVLPRYIPIAAFGIGT